MTSICNPLQMTYDEYKHELHKLNMVFFHECENMIIGYTKRLRVHTIGWYHTYKIPVYDWKW